MAGMKRIAILGSTGSIGTQALDVIREHPDIFSVELLVAQNSWELLVQQAIEFQPNTVIIANQSHYQRVKEALANHPIKVYTGKQSIVESVVSSEVDMVLTAMVGFAGLEPTLSAIEAGKAIALANKETLVVAGELVTKAAMQKRVPIIPVDSEHSAIFQCLVGHPYFLLRFFISNPKASLNGSITKVLNGFEEFLTSSVLWIGIFYPEHRFFGNLDQPLITLKLDSVNAEFGKDHR